MLMSYIRQINLDVFWRKAPNTISDYKSAFNKGKNMCKYFKIGPSYIHSSPCHIGDNSGFIVALHILRTFQSRNTHSKSAQEFDAIKNLQTIYLHTHKRSRHAAHLYSVFR